MKGRRNAAVDPWLFYVSGDNRPRADNNVITYGHWENCCAGSYRNTRSDIGLLPVIWIARRSTGFEEVVDEHHAVAYERVFANRYALTYKGVGLDPRTFSDGDTPLNLNKWTDEDLISEGASV